jgi:hypothetical protein
MPSEATKKISARERARQKLAAQREERRRRDEANEADLIEILKANESRDTAAAKRDAAIAKAEETYRDTVADIEATIGERLTAMKERGETIADIAELAELSPADVRKALTAAKKRTAGEPDRKDPPPAVVERSAPGAESSEALGEAESAAPRQPVSVGVG